MHAEILQLAIAILAPWYFGTQACRWLLRRERHTPGTLSLGMGYFLGQFAVVILLYLSGRLGMGFPFWGITGVLVLAAATLQWQLRQMTTAATPAHPAQHHGSLPAWQWACLAVLGLLVAIRYGTLAQEVTLRPLYAWDAWMNWAPKAIVWFHSNELTAFVSPRAWLETYDGSAYTLGALGAWRFPPGVPLIQLWTMLALGETDHNLVYLPWLLAPIALALTLYGYLRLYALPSMGAAVACYLLLSLPYLNVHTALAGYADLWLMGAFCGSVMALGAWERSRNKAYLALALTLAAFTATLKVPGLIFAGIVLLCAVFVALELRPRNTLLGLLGAAVITMIVLTVGIELEIPGAGPLVLSLEELTVPYIGSFSLAFHPVQAAVLSTLYKMSNWHLLWYLLVGAVGGSIALRRGAQHSLSLKMALALGMAFILFVYFFTYRYKFALDFTQVNRALIYLAPLAVAYIALTVSALLPDRKPADT